MLKVKRRGGSFQLSGTIDGKRVRKAMRARTMEEAQIERLEEESKVYLRGRLGVTVGQVVDAYVSYRAPHSGTVSLLKRIKDKWGSVDVGSMRLEDVRDWAEGLGVADATLRRYVKAVRTVLYWGEKGGLYMLPRRLHVVLPGEPDPRDRFLESMAEVNALVGAADEWFQPMVTFLFHTGIRVGTVCALEWGQVEDTHVTISTRKGSGRLKTHRLPLNREAKGAVAAAAKRWGRSGHVFRTEYGGVMWPQKVYGPWAKMCEAAGVENFTPHDARRTFATLLIRNGVAVEVIRKLLCHEGDEMVRRYAYLAPNQLASAVEVLG